MTLVIFRYFFRFLVTTVICETNTFVDIPKLSLLESAFTLLVGQGEAPGRIPS